MEDEVGEGDRMQKRSSGELQSPPRPPPRTVDGGWEGKARGRGQVTFA